MPLRIGVFLSAFLLAALGYGQALKRQILPGDRLQLVSSNCDLCLCARVGEDGRVEIEGVDPIPVATLDLDSAAQRIRAALLNADLLAPDLRLFVIPERGAEIRISGAVSSPLELRFGSGVELGWLISQATPLEGGDLESVLVSGPDGAERVGFSEGLWLHGGESVMVPVSTGSTDVVVAGGVVTPSSLRFKKGMTVSGAIDEAGGVSAIGDPTRISLLRHGEPAPLAWPEDGAIELRAGETVQVGVRQERRYVIVYGDVVHPGLVDFTPGMTASQAVKAAGGASGGSLKKVVSVRTILASAKKPVRLSLAFIESLRIPDPVLVPDEIVEVSKS